MPLRKEKYTFAIKKICAIVSFFRKAALLHM